jgi:hypothetical protein
MVDEEVERGQIGWVGAPQATSKQFAAMRTTDIQGNRGTNYIRTTRVVRDSEGTDQQGSW